MSEYKIGDKVEIKSCGEIRSPTCAECRSCCRTAKEWNRVTIVDVIVDYVDVEYDEPAIYRPRVMIGRNIRRVNDRIERLTSV
jgi:hypothetical protein